MRPSSSTLKMTKAQCIQSKYQIACTYLTSSTVSSPCNIRHNRHMTAHKGQEWRLMPTASSSSGARESIDAQFPSVETQTLRFFVQLLPHQPIERFLHTLKQRRHRSTKENMNSSSPDAVAYCRTKTSFLSKRTFSSLMTIGR